jgi:hypothetical protein
VNPLAPSYVVRDDDGNPMTIGAIPGSSPKRLPSRSKAFPGSLDVADIHGAVADTKRLGAFHSTQRRHFLNPTDTSDIEGAQPNSLKRGVQTKRATNPLAP